MRVVLEIQAHNNEQLLTDVGYAIAHFCYVTVMLTLTATCQRCKVKLRMACCFLPILHELNKRSSTKAKQL
jgi:hypothetical protein